MKKLMNPKWLFLINTIPIILLFFLYISQYNIIKSLLEPESIRLWKIFGGTLGVLGILNFLYALYLTVKKKNVSVIYGLAALLIYIPFIYLYGYHIDSIIPFSLPSWMIPGNLMMYLGTFLMPTLAYALFILVIYFTPKKEDLKPWLSFLYALLVPVIWYVFIELILPFWQPPTSKYLWHAGTILIIVFTLLFLFFLIRSIYILTIKKSALWNKYELLWKIPVALIFPLLGLAVNNGVIFDKFGDYVFGDFSNIWFYLLAVINALVICLPRLDHKKYRIALFLGRSITFSFTFYFFLVFLPYLPLSIVAIIAFGLGFLMLTPLMLFVIHVNELSKDLQYLKEKVSTRVLWVSLSAGFLILPLIITLTFTIDKHNLEKTLDYIYTPDYYSNYDINTKSLKKTIHTIRQHKDKNGFGIFSNQTPYLSPYFNWLVLDNLTLSDTKINQIENIFFKKTADRPARDNIRKQDVVITDTTIKSNYDKSQNAWVSQVHLEITNNSANGLDAEYATTIELPPGCWISDYYLYVGEEKKPGILAEKKSAMWVFSEIRNRKRDPGILYYLTGNRISLRVFPFTKNEVRKTGFELIHKEPFTLFIDSTELQLGKAGIPADGSFENQDMAYISTNKKESLPKVQRQPYFHFLVNASEGNASRSEEYKSRIRDLMQQHPDLENNSKISRVNSFVQTFEIDDPWQNIFNNSDFTGGFFLDRAIKSTLVKSYQRHDNKYPIIVVVSDSLEKAVLDKDFSDLAITFPESKFFYHLTENATLIPHSLLHQPESPAVDTAKNDFFIPARKYTTTNEQVFYLPDNGKPSVLLKSDNLSLDKKEINSRDWQSALMMHGNWMSQNLNPAQSKEEWLSLVKSSFRSGIMTALTSYIVVENEAQEAMLKKKQKQVLSGNKSLDAGENSQRMSEPGLGILALLLGLILWLRKKRHAAVK
ncbi:MAG: MSEP-CTERM sorting domain-containing protein [Bacteroidales bacterium]